MQDHPGAARAAPGKATASLYLMSWVAVAAFGLGYIGVAATRPDLLGVILPLAEPSQDLTVAGRGNNDLAEEMTSLRKWIHELQHELAATKSTLQEQVAHSSAVLQRLAATEERLTALKEVREVKEVREPVGKAPVPQPRVQTRAQAPAPALVVAAAEPPARAAPSAVAATEVPASAGNVRVINGAASQIATGSVPDPAAPAPPPSATTGFSAPKVTTAAPAGPRGIEIGSAESLEALRARWGDLAGRNADVLGELAPRYRLAADGRSAPFTLLAGPFENPTDATRTCNTLRAKGVTCRVGAYSGNAF